MPVPSNDDRSINSVFSQNVARCVDLHISTRHLLMNTWNTQNTAAIQVIRMRRKPQHMERAAGGAHDAGLQPSDTTEPARLEGMQGGIVVPLCFGHPVHLLGVLSWRATAESPKTRSCAYIYQSGTRPASL